MSLDRALDGVPFEIDLFRCWEAARKLSSYTTEPISEPWSDASEIDQLAFKILFISICHQMNWDFLQSTLAQYLFPNPTRRLQEIASTPASRIAELLKEYPKQARIRAAERASMLRATASSLQELLAPGGALKLLLHAPVLEGEFGFYAAISQIDAYTGDPLEKKPRVLAHDLYREGILSFADPENLRPAVEYHLIRLYLRSGRVFPTTDSVENELKGYNGPARPRLVKVLREKVDEAMRATAFYAGLDAATLNYVEWQVARSICVATLGPELRFDYCLGHADPDVPADIQVLAKYGCPFACTCRALNDARYGWFREPHFEKVIY